ncbi:DUF4249 domain-containing protein [Mucilaginibacter terrae]|uniref:DUF4249 domain-containing protein n=1 Tax=Mucilaginibacter terrae TaxID=1955052 RepID=UPI003642261E
MKNFKHYLWFIAVSVAFVSCQKVVEIDVNTSSSQLVIEGDITNIRNTQYVKISRSVAYTSTNLYPSVSGAIVTVNDNAGNSWRFNETTPGLYSLVPMRGQPGRTYTLNVTVGDQNFTGSSLMPPVVKVDSLSLSQVTFGSTTRKLVAVNFTDPRGVANQYRYILRINGKQSNRIYAQDDRLTDGNIIKEELYPDGDDDNEEDELKPGDKAEVEIQDIDKNIFNFWYTLRQQRRGGPGGGTTPGNPPSNLSNNALGYFSAHTYQSLEITIP